MAVQIDFSSGLDKAWEENSLAGILAAPPSALAGLSEADDAALKDDVGRGSATSAPVSTSPSRASSSS